jgi:hypothetical protein
VDRVANCDYSGKDLETQPTAYHFNKQGFRSNVDFGPKPPGIYRIVLVGSSVGVAAGTPIEKTIASALPAELSKRVGRRVELYNEAISGVPGLPQSLALRLNEVLATKPDLVLWVLTRWDIKDISDPIPVAPEAPQKPSALASSRQALRDHLAEHRFPDAASDLLRTSRSALVASKNLLLDSRSAFLLQHYLYEIPNVYVKYSISGPDEFAGYLKAETSDAWKSRLQIFQSDLARTQTQVRDAGATLAVVLVPSRPQAAMISMGEWPEGVDPFKLNDQLRSIVIGQSAVYVDVFPAFRQIHDSDRYYFPVDGHPTPEGQVLISNLIADQLGNGSVPALRAANSSERALVEAQ